MILTVCAAFLSGMLCAQEADDGFVVPLDQDFSKVVKSSLAADGGQADSAAPKIQMGTWIETTSDNVSLIRNISDGTKSGYEFDNAHFKSNMNWWFWGEINRNFHLDAEIAVWDFDKTLYQANSYADNVPDVTWGDGLQSISSMFFAFLNDANDSGIGAFNKFGFNISSPFVDARFGYGDLKANGMSEFKGIYTVIDRWDFVGKGYTELKNGARLREFGDFKIDALAALSRMRDSFGTYDYIDVKYSDKAEIALTFGSTTTEEQLFFYNRTNKNAASAYIAAMPLPFLKIEGHALGSFGTGYALSPSTSAVAGRISASGDSWNVKIKQSAAGVKANSVWGSDGTDYDDINAGTLTTQIDAEKSFSVKNVNVKLALDEGITFADSSHIGDGKLLFRSQPSADVEFLEKFTVGAYGVIGTDRLAKETSARREIVPYLSEAGVEFCVSDVAEYLKKLTFDYAVSCTYDEWKSGNSYARNMTYHSIMADAQLSDNINVHAASLIRLPNEKVETNVPFAFTLGMMLKKTRLPGHPMFWMHFTYGMNPYEDNNYSLFRADDPLNKKIHRTYLLNSLESDTTTSHISLGFIWDL